MNTNLLFPQTLYPLHSKYIYLLENMITSSAFTVSAIDMEILSIALGNEARQLFNSISQTTGEKQKLYCIITDGLSLKVAVKKCIKANENELSNAANKGVVNTVMNQYQAKIDKITRLKEEALSAEKEKLEHQRMLNEKKRKQKLQKQQEILKKKRLEHEKNHVDYPEFDVFNVKRQTRVDKLLKQLQKKAINEDDLQWLDDIGFANEIIYKKNHTYIAKQHLVNWQEKQKPWELVNASAAYRKLDRPNTIKPILDGLYPFKFTNNNDKLKSALLTTYGGICRDTSDFKRSLFLGHEAHEVTPINFMPCTLLGAVYLSTGEFEAGHEWYQKAKERGFSQEAYDNDIRSIYHRASHEMKKRLKQNLIDTGHRYKWIES